MTTHTLPSISYNPDEDWLRPILGAVLVHLLVVLIFGLAWLWSPTRNTSAAAGEGTLEASLELSGSEVAAAQWALNQSIAQSTYESPQPAIPTRQTLAQPIALPPSIPQAVVPVIMPDTQEQMRVLAEQQRQQEEAERQRQAALAVEQQRQQEEAERQRQAALAVEQQRQQEEAERQRQAELAAEQQRQQEEAERQRQAELAAEQQRQQEEAAQLAQQQQQEAERQQKIVELRQRREQLEQQAAEEQQRLERIRNEQRRANQAAAAVSNGASSSSSTNNTGNTGSGNSGNAGNGGDNRELLGRYKAAIQNAILRQWTRPESIALGQTCRLTINQLPGGQVIDVKFTSDCSYDEAGRRSVERAILRASPLPYRGFENVAERVLIFNFEAQDR